MLVRRRTAARFLIAASLILAAGAAVTVVVSWVCVLWGPLRDSRDPTGVPVRWPGEPPKSWPLTPRRAWSAATWANSWQRGEAPTYRGQASAEGWRVMVVVSSGVPLRSLSHTYTSESDSSGNPLNHLSGLSLPRAAANRLTDGVSWRRRLPTAVLWPGFLGNTAIYAGLTAGILRAHVTLRRFRRRGRCIACGYSRAGLAGDAACPECGAGDALSAVP